MTGVVPVMWLLVLIASSPGCRDTSGLKLYEVSGTLTYQNKPVKDGEIVFAPDRSKGNSGPGGYAEVKDGKFRTRDGKGVVGGPYLLIISGRPNMNAGESELQQLFASSDTPYMLFPVQELPFDLPQSDTTLELNIPAAQ